jgi:hypothetical protein
MLIRRVMLNRLELVVAGAARETGRGAGAGAARETGRGAGAGAARETGRGAGAGGATLIGLR